MPDLLIPEIDAKLHANLTQWALEQGKPLAQLVHEILVAAERVHENFDPTQSRSTRVIRRCRDGGCGFCDDIEQLLEAPKVNS